MYNKIKEIEKLVNKEISKKIYYDFLPSIKDIILMLKEIVKNENQDIERIKKLLGGIGRLVIEDINFSETYIGTELISFCNNMLSYIDEETE